MSYDAWRTLFNVAGALAAAPAALFWLQASALQLPPPPNTFDTPPPETTAFFQSLLLAAKLNKRAAACSCVSALCVGLATAIDLLK